MVYIYILYDIYIYGIYIYIYMYDRYVYIYIDGISHSRDLLRGYGPSIIGDFTKPSES